MPERDTHLYDTSYGHFGDELYAAIRRETYGEDLGQSSWLTADEQRRFSERLGIDASTDVLEVASGSGGPALFTAELTGCRITGVDLQPDGVAAANAAARERGLADRARFVEANAEERLPFDDGSFDAVICIDAMNHLYGRAAILRDWHRLLRPGGRILFTNPATITGLVRRDEMVSRSSGVGEFVFTAPGADERLIREAGFSDVEVEDVTENAARMGRAWHDARERHAAELERIEGAEGHAKTQRFLWTVATLAGERRLSRLAYLARR